MRNLANLRQLLVDGMWNEEDGQPGVLLWSGDRKDMPEGKLRSLLFAWHKGSWYGSDIDETRNNGQSVLKLSPLQAMDYLSNPLPVNLLQVDWSPRLHTLRKMAIGIRDIVLNGWFVPDWDVWDEDRRGWKAAFPEAFSEQEESWRGLLQSAEEEGDGEAKRWLGAVVEEWIAESAEVGKAWSDIGRSVGESVVRHKGVDEEEWLIAIGLEKDVLPFRVALQLSEPGPGHGWSLRPAVQDQNGGAWLPIAWSGGEAAVISEEEDGAKLPEEWVELLPVKLMKETAKWLSVLPDLAEQRDVDEPLLRQELSEDEAWYLLQHGSVALLEAGCPVLLPAWWEAARSRKLKLRAKLKSSVGSAAQPMFGLNQIMQFDWKLALGDVDLSEAEFMEMAEQNRKLFRVGNEWVHLDPQDAEKIRSWLNRAGKRKGLTFRDVLEMHLRGESVADVSDDPESDLRAEVELNQHLEAWLSQLQHISHIPQANVPVTFKGELRPYQLEGVSWLLFLRRFGLGGVLADDMGLGKTIQFMAYLLCIKHEELGIDGPSLLICPTSVIGNWEKELARFAPELNVMLHYGSRRLKGEELREAAARQDLVITSYSLAQLDEEELEGVSWNVLCLDEAQNIKNVYTKQSRAIRQLEARHRIALTGTPMENRLTELWSIYDFINPGYLGSLQDFRRAVVAPIEKNRDEGLISGLQRWVKPFMLRRVKKDPAIQLSLPDKIETKSYMTLTTEQGALYENMVSDLLEKLDTLDAMSRRGLILSTLTKLKQLCDHPSLLLNENAGKEWDPERSGKTSRLLEMCEEIAAEGERCLIFTQYVDMGKQIQLLLENKLGIEVPYLHGGVPKQKRDEMISRFQSEEVPGCAFVLSLKAGGTGLNLTAANHVFHFDRWWNPAVENQATDRAFRIGQTRRVQVHKFITLGTLEERIDEMIDSKQSLNDQVVSQSDQWITEMSTDELRELFALRDGWMKE
ncbi:DEAD/DEAH box helicase [Paenibacillus sp. CAU 1782]